MSNKKPLGKMNKAELLELAKSNKDDIRVLDFNLTSMSAENEIIKSRLQKATEQIRTLKAEKVIDQKMIKRYNAQKGLLSEESGQVKVGTYKIPSPCKVRWLQFKSWFLGLFK